jgi:[ribosomal protein S5]-alanine N-acetyltransferase
MSKTRSGSQSERYYLTKFRHSDIDEITRLLQAHEVVASLAQIPLNYTRDDAVEHFNYLQTLEKNRPEIASLKFTIREKSSEKPMGRITLAQDEDGWNLGYWLGVEYWGQGIMTWACKEILQIAGKRGITKICAWPKCGNWASRRVLEKNGFKHIKDGEMYFPAHGRSYDCWVMEANLD